MVCPEENNPDDDMLDKLKKSVNALQDKDMQTLLVYYSGHYKPDKGGFELVHSKRGETGIQYEKQYLSAERFQEAISQILYGSIPASERSQVSKRAIIFLDCSAGPAITPPQEHHPLPLSSENKSQQTKLPSFTFDKNVRFVQINACRPNQSTVVQKDGSIFRKFLVQCLTKEALGEMCINSPCNQCSIDGDFVTVGKMLKYLGDHIENHSYTTEECEPIMNTYNISKLDANIAYVVNFKVDLKFTLKMEKQTKYVTIAQRMFSELKELQILLFGEFVGKCQLFLCARCLIVKVTILWLS